MIDTNKKADNGFDYKKHADILLDVYCIVSNALKASEGLQLASGYLNLGQYSETAAGVFGLMALALDKAYDVLSEAERHFRLAHGLKYRRIRHMPGKILMSLMETTNTEESNNDR